MSSPVDSPRLRVAGNGLAGFATVGLFASDDDVEVVDTKIAAYRNAHVKGLRSCDVAMLALQVDDAEAFLALPDAADLSASGRDRFRRLHAAAQRGDLPPLECFTFARAVEVAELSMQRDDAPHKVAAEPAAAAMPFGEHAAAAQEAMLGDSESENDAPLVALLALMPGGGGGGGDDDDGDEEESLDSLLGSDSDAHSGGGDGGGSGDDGGGGDGDESDDASDESASSGGGGGAPAAAAAAAAAELSEGAGTSRCTITVNAPDDTLAEA